MRQASDAKKLSGALDYINEINNQAKVSSNMMKTQLELVENSARTREIAIKDAIDGNLKQKNDLIETRILMSTRMDE